jgi:hypothetical protein
MNKLLIVIIFILSFSVFAQDYQVTKIFKNPEAPKGKTYLAVIENKDWHGEAGDRIIIFGKENGKKKYRAFGLGGMDFYEYEGASNSGMDDYYKFEYESKGPGKTLLVTLTAKKGEGKKSTIEYLPYESTGSKSFANEIWKDVQADKKKLRSLDKIQTLSQFKRRLELVTWDYGYIPGDYGYSSDDDDFPIATADLQYEFHISETYKNKMLAKTYIQKNGKDEITKKYREAKYWVKNSDEALEKVEAELEYMYQNDDWDRWDNAEPVFSSYNKVGENLKNDALKDAAKKFLKYEIKNASGFECEDSYYLWETVTWVLVDGSTYTYSPYHECD